jgi:hypothetical protein
MVSCFLLVERPRLPGDAVATRDSERSSGLGQLSSKQKVE